MKQITFYSISCPRCLKVERLLLEICKKNSIAFIKIGFWKSLCYGFIRLKKMPIVIIDGIESDLEKIIGMNY